MTKQLFIFKFKRFFGAIIMLMVITAMSVGTSVKAESNSNSSNSNSNDGLEISFELCHDGLDNDNDGASDINDDDCTSFYICIDLDIPFIDLPGTGCDDDQSSGGDGDGDGDGNGTSTATSTPGNGNGTSTATSTPGTGNGTSTATSTPGTDNGTSTATSTPGTGNGTSTATSTATSTSGGGGSTNVSVTSSGGTGGGRTAASGFTPLSLSGLSNIIPTPMVLGASIGGDNDIQLGCPVPTFTTYMGINRSNSTEEVTRLQSVLNQLLGTSIPVTGFFDLQTDNAVRQLQMREKESILLPWIQAGRMTGYVSTGFVYKTTRWWLNNKLCPMNLVEMPLVP